MRAILFASSLVLLSACTTAESGGPEPGSPEGSCRKEPAQQFIGQPATEELGAKITAATGARVLRWVPKDGMVTMDFNADRLTVQLDGSNKVLTANCG